MWLHSFFNLQPQGIEPCNHVIRSHTFLPPDRPQVQYQNWLKTYKSSCFRCAKSTAASCGFSPNVFQPDFGGNLIFEKKRRVFMALI